MNDLGMPWSPRSRQKQGERTEQQMAKKHGARLTPRSGAGRIKQDAVSDDTIFEYKDAAKSHTLKGADLNLQLVRAIQQGKDTRYIVYFTEYDLTADITLRRGKG